MDEPEFIKSSFRRKETGGVEVAYSADGQTVYVRDGKQPGKPLGVFTLEEWVSFIAGAQNHEFDFGLLDD